MLTPRDALRYHQIFSTFVAHGFEGLVEPLDVHDLQVWNRLRHGRLLANEGTTDAEATGEQSAYTASQRARHLRLALQELGPTFIKLGQILSTRCDLLPPAYIAELALLQDQVTPIPFAVVAAVIEAELGEPLEVAFAQFDTAPLGVASIGQVHGAVLPNGQQVVVKVQRPGVDRLIEQDLVVLAQLAQFASGRLELARQLDLPALVEEFGWVLRCELDYAAEGRNCEFLASALADDSTVRVPTIFWSHTRGRVLTMERLHGVRIDDTEAIAASGIDRTAVAEKLAKLTLRMVLDIGTFHADPHPGNLVLLPDGAIGLLDFGMVGTVDDRLRERLLLLLLGVVERDPARVVDQFLLLGAGTADAPRAALETDVARLLERYYGRPLAEICVDRLVHDLMATVRRHKLRLPSNLVLLLKTLAMSEALTRQLDPSFDLAAVADPFVRRAVRQFLTPGYWGDKLKVRSLEALLLGLELPGHAQRLLTRLDRNDLTIRVRSDELPAALSGLNSMVNRLTVAILTAAGAIILALLTSATSTNANPSTPFHGAFTVGVAAVAVTTTWLLFGMWRSQRQLSAVAR